MVRADACIESFRRHAPDLASAADACWEASLTRDDETTLPKPALERVPSISVDYAIMEKEERISLLPFSGSWSDVGSWDSLSALIDAHRPETGDDPNAITVDAPPSTAAGAPSPPSVLKTSLSSMMTTRH